MTSTNNMFLSWKQNHVLKVFLTIWLFLVRNSISDETVPNFFIRQQESTFFKDADALCRKSDGGELASVRSILEFLEINELITQALGDKDRLLWFGMLLSCFIIS